MLLMVTLSPYVFPSFLPRLLSSLQGSSLRSFEGGGRELHIRKEWWWRGNRLVEEEEACSVRGGHVLWHVADFKIVNKTSEEQQETEQQEDPPQPVLTIEVASEVVGEPDDKNPLDEGKAETAYGSVASCNGIGQAEG